MSGGHDGPRTLEEMHEEEELKAAEKLHEGIKGFYLTNPFNKNIEDIRLGMREDLADEKLGLAGGLGKTLRKEYGKAAHEVLIDTRVTEKLRQNVKEHKTHEHKSAFRFVPGTKEWRKERSKEIENVGRFFTSPLKWFREDYDELAGELEKEYGDASDLNKMKAHLNKKLHPVLVGAGPTLAQIDSLNKYIGIAAGSPLAPDVLTKTTPLQLEKIRDEIVDTHGHKIFEHNHDFELLLELRQIEATEKAKVLSIHISDPHRLRTFVVDKLGKATTGSDAREIYDLLIGMYGDNFYDQLNGNTKRCEVLARIESDFSTGNPTKLKDWLIEIKTEVADKLPQSKIEQTEKEKEQTTKIDAYHSNLKRIAIELSKRYSKALPLRQRIQQLKGDVDALKPSAAGAKNSNYSTASDRYNKALDEKVNLIQEVQDLENEYKNTGNEFLSYVEGDLKKVVLSKPATATTVAITGIPEFDKINNVIVKDVSTSDDIFDEDSTILGTNDLPTPKKSPPPFGSDLAKHVSDLAKNQANYANDLNKQIKKLTQKAGSQSEISDDHLLFQLNIRAVRELNDKYGHPQFTDEQQILKIARMATSFAEIDAKNVELFRAGNREIAESKVKGWSPNVTIKGKKIGLEGVGGVWRKSKQQIASAFFHTDTFRARDIIEHISGLDHAFEAFKDLSADASLSDIRRAIKHHGGMSTETLMKFYLHLQQALKSFKVGDHRIVEIADKDWPLEQVALFAQKIHAELEAREFCRKIEHPETEEDIKLKKTNKAAYFQKMLNQRDESLKKLEATQLEQMRNPDSDWQVSFLKSLMKGKYGEAYEKALAAGKEQGLSGDALKKYIQSEGSIPKTILKHLMTGLALKEGWNIASGTVRWTGSKLGSACKKAAAFGAKKGAGFVAKAWQHLGWPAIKGTGRGIAAVGRGVGKAGKFALWTTPKFFFWDAPKWTVKTTAKVAWWPFKMVGRGAKGFWNFFSYTPADAAKDKARYEKNKNSFVHMFASGTPANDNAHGHDAHAPAANDNAHGHGGEHGEHKKAA